MSNRRKMRALVKSKDPELSDARVFGLIFAYLGEGMAPPFPRYPQLEMEGVVDVSFYIRRCNYFNTLENGIDQAHVPFTHAKSNFTKFGLTGIFPRSPRRKPNTASRCTAPLQRVSRINHYLMPTFSTSKARPNESAEMWREAFAWRVPSTT